MSISILIFDAQEHATNKCEIFEQSINLFIVASTVILFRFYDWYWGMNGRKHCRSSQQCGDGGFWSRKIRMFQSHYLTTDRREYDFSLIAIELTIFYWRWMVFLGNLYRHRAVGDGIASSATTLNSHDWWRHIYMHLRQRTPTKRSLTVVRFKCFKSFFSNCSFALTSQRCT